MNEFYAIDNWAPMSSEFTDGRGGDEGIGGDEERKAWKFRTL